MAGIKANSLTVTMLDGDTAVDKEIGGFVDDELVTLTTYPTGSVYTWALSKPDGSTARANLSASSGASVTFTPDVGGVYFIAATVDGTAYQMRLTAVAVAVANSTQVIRFQNTTDASVPTPLNGGVSLFNSDQFDGLSYKLDDGTVGRIYPLAGEANTMSSAGSGASIVLTKSGVDLPVRGFVGLNDITCAASGNDLQVDGAALLALDGSRAMTGDLDMGTNAITNVGNIDGVDVSDHSARHENGGADEISVAGLSGVLADPQTPATHASTHHSGGSDALALGSIAGVLASDAAHGVRGGGTQHAVATTSVAGFMSAADKTAHDNTIAANLAAGERSGFRDRTEVSHGFNDGSLQYTASPTGASFTFDVKNTPYTKSSPESVNWTNVEGIHFIYYNSSGVLTHTVTASDWTDAVLGDGALVTAFYWDAANSVSFQRLNELHGTQMSGASHLHDHLTRGTQWESGGTLGDIIADGGGGLDTHAQLSVSTVSIADEDLRFTFSNGSPQTLAVPAQIPVYYRDGAGGLWRKRTANNFPFVYSGDGSGYVGGSGRVPYNLNTAGTWSLSEVGNNDFVLAHIFATTDIAEPIIAIQGQASYGTIIAARSGATTEINSLQLGQLAGLAAEHTPLGTIILQTNGGYANTPNAQIRSTDTGADYVDFRGNERVGVPAAATDHDSLTGVPNSTAHTLFPLLDGTRTYTGDIDMGGYDVTNVAIVTGAAASDLALNAVTGQTVNTTVNGVTELSVSGTVVDAQSNTIRTTGVLELGTNPASTGTIRIPSSGTVYFKNNAGSHNLLALHVNSIDDLKLGDANVSNVYIECGGRHRLRVSGADELTVSGTVVDAQSNTIRTTGVLEVGANPATVGLGRFANDQWLAWRNAANSGNVLALKLSAANQLNIGDGVTLGILFNVATGWTHRLLVNSVNQLSVGSGLIDAYGNTLRTTGIIEVGTNPATAGTYRGPNSTTALTLRNNANSANVTAIGISTSDEIEVGLAATVKLGNVDMNGNDIIDVGLATSNAEETASSSSNVITLPFNTSNAVKTTLTENITTINVTAPSSGVGRFQWRVTQAAGSSYTLGGWAAAIDWGAAGTPTMTATNSAWDIYTFWYDGTNWSGSYVQGYGP